MSAGVLTFVNFGLSPYLQTYRSSRIAQIFPDFEFFENFLYEQILSDHVQIRQASGPKM